MQKKYVLEFDVNTEKVESKVEGLDKQIDGVKDSTAGATGLLDKFSGGAVTAFRNGVKGARGMIASMKTLRGAIISTGIGALVVAVVSLIQAVSRLQRVQDQYKQATAALGVVMDTLLDVVALLGEKLIDLFKDPQTELKNIGELIKENITNRLEGVVELVPKLGKAISLLFKGEFAEAGEVALDAVAKVSTGIEDFTDKAEKATEVLKKQAEAAVALERASQRLEDIRIGEIKTQAARNKQIAEARLLAEDETLSYKKREEALTRALDLESKNLQEKLNNAKEEARIIAQRNALTESSREDIRAQAEAEARVFQLEEQSLKQQKRIFTELQSLRKQRQAEINKARQEQEKKDKAEAERKEKLEQEKSDAIIQINDTLNETRLSQEQKEIEAEKRKYRELIALANQYGLDTTELEEVREAKLKEINARYREQERQAQEAENAKRIEEQKQLNDLRINSAIGVGNAIAQVAEAFAGDNEARAKKAFNVSKAVGIAEALVNTYQGVTAALTDKLTPTPVRIAQAITAGAVGLAQVAKIKSTQFQSSGGGSIPSGSASSGGQSQPSTPQVDFSFLQQGANQTSVQAYVLESNVTNSQQANQLIQDQATL